MSPNPTVQAVEGRTLADYTAPGLVIPRLRGEDAAGVIQELSQAMQREGRVPDFLPFYHAAMNREFLVSTEMESGMAFPHARLPGLTEVSFAFGRSDVPLAWGTRGVRSVRMVFLLAAPATDAAQYLLLISGLARLSREPRLVEALLTAREPAEVIATLRQIPVRRNGAANAPKKAVLT